MKVYVDGELPKDCIDCPCESEYYCNLLNEDVGCCKWGEIHKDCPLQSLSDYTKQVRKEVVQKIEEWLRKQMIFCGGKATKDDILTANASNQVLYDLKEFLDQFQGEDK